MKRKRLGVQEKPRLDARESRVKVKTCVRAHTTSHCRIYHISTRRVNEIWGKIGLCERVLSRRCRNIRPVTLSTRIKTPIPYHSVQKNQAVKPHSPHRDLCVRQTPVWGSSSSLTPTCVLSPHHECPTKYADLRRNVFACVNVNTKHDKGQTLNPALERRSLQHTAVYKPNVLALFDNASH